jgi:hypothetical protein
VTGERRRPGLAGADAEAGSRYRAAVASWIAVQALRGEPLRQLDLLSADDAVPETVEIETDDPVDDVGLRLSSGGRAFLQVKRRLDLGIGKKSAFVKAVDQWKELVGTCALDPQRDRLVVAAGKVTRPVRDLSEALERGRRAVAGARSEREEAAHARLRELIGDLDPAQQDLLLACAVVWELDVEDDTAPAAQNAQAALENGVVQYGHGFAAWRALCDACDRAAPPRAGFDLDGLLRVLRAAGLPLVADRQGLASARAVARIKAADRHRQLVIKAGEELNLLALGARLPPIPLAEADAETAVRSRDGDTPKERALTWSVRRRGRVVLVGPPGSGKSTTLRASAADFARREDWPLPVHVNLDRLARRLKDMSFRKALLELATEDLDAADAELMCEAVENGLRQGPIALFLDALDEAREQRRTVVQGLRRFLDTVHQDVEVVLSTREVGYADAQTLGFNEVAVSPPRNIDVTVRKILEVAARNASVPALDQPSWIRDRVRWVENVLESDPGLRRTPLIPVLLALLASRHDSALLPTRRAPILRAVLEDVCRVWEAAQRREGQVRLGLLDGERAVAALLDALLLESSVLDERSSAERKEIERVLGEWFAARFQLPTAEAVVVATEAASFWDEAGVFVTATDGMVAPSARLFVEIGAAACASELEASSALEAWVRAAAADRNRWETLRLATGLDGRIAQLVWSEVEETDGASEESADLLFVLAQAVAEGAELGAPALKGLTERLLMLLGDETRSWRAGLALARMPVPEEHRRNVREQFARYLPPRNAPTAQALAVLGWEESGEEADSILRAALRATWPRGHGGDWLVDDGFAEALVGAAERLRTDGPDALDLIASALGRASIGVDRRLADILREEGRGDAVAEYYARFTSRLRIPRYFRLERETNKILLDLLATVGEPVPLAQRQARRLDELCDFVESVQLPEADGASVIRSVLDSPDEVRFLFRHVAPLTGLDIGVIVGEAKLVRELLEGPDASAVFSMLFDGGVDRGLTRWDLAPDPSHLRNGLRAHLAGYRWLAVPAAVALASCPARAELLAELDDVFDDYEPWSRRLAGVVMMELEADRLERAREWLEHPDPVRRIVAAKRLATVLEADTAVRVDVERALGDEDEGVREAVLEGLSPEALDEDFLGRARVEMEGEPTGWFCIWCGETNTATASGCASCNTSGPDAAKAARELLRGAGLDVPEPRGRGRHVRVVNLDRLE